MTLLCQELYNHSLKKTGSHSHLRDRKDQIPRLAVCDSPGEVYLLNIFFSLLPTSVTRQVGVSVKGWGKFFLEE